MKKKKFKISRKESEIVAVIELLELLNKKRIPRCYHKWRFRRSDVGFQAMRYNSSMHNIYMGTKDSCFIYAPYQRALVLIGDNRFKDNILISKLRERFKVIVVKDFGPLYDKECSYEFTIDFTRGDGKEFQVYRKLRGKGSMQSLLREYANTLPSFKWPYVVENIKE